MNETRGCMVLPGVIPVFLMEPAKRTCQIGLFTSCSKSNARTPKVSGNIGNPALPQLGSIGHPLVKAEAFKQTSLRLKFGPPTKNNMSTNRRRWRSVGPPGASEGKAFGIRGESKTELPPKKNERKKQTTLIHRHKFTHGPFKGDG